LTLSCYLAIVEAFDSVLVDLLPRLPARNPFPPRCEVLTLLYGGFFASVKKGIYDRHVECIYNSESRASKIALNGQDLVKNI
jgi:hypothetical protein